MLKWMMAVNLAGLMSLTCLAQTSGGAADKLSAAPQAMESAAKKFYHLNFTVQELENDRVINSRSYSMIMRTDKDRSSIRAGEKVPFSTSVGNTTQYQQVDVGVSIDCQKLEEEGNGVSLYIKADSSSVLETHGENPPQSSLPIIRHNQWESNVVLPLRQATVLFSSDDPASKRKLQLQLTVTPIR